MFLCIFYVLCAFLEEKRLKNVPRPEGDFSLRGASAKLAVFQAILAVFSGFRGVFLGPILGVFFEPGLEGLKNVVFYCFLRKIHVFYVFLHFLQFFYILYNFFNFFTFFLFFYIFFIFYENL